VAARLGVPESRLEEALGVIRHLDPKPGLRYNNPVNPTIVPDVIVEKTARKLPDSVQRGRDCPACASAGHYRTMAEEVPQRAGEEALTYLKEKSPVGHVVPQEHRGAPETIYKVGQEIVDFPAGLPGPGPRPHAPARPARRGGARGGPRVHGEPRGSTSTSDAARPFPMKYFFNTGIGTLEARRLVHEGEGATEGPRGGRRPLEALQSDQRLADILKREGAICRQADRGQVPGGELNIPTLWAAGGYGEIS